MQLQQLMYILEVAKTGSINKAAHNLFVSQPNLSGAIANLEKELGIIIFNRTPKGVTLTQEGTLLLKYARAILGQVDQLKDFYSENNKEQIKMIEVSQNKSVYLGKAISNTYNESNKHLKITLNICAISDVIKNVFTMKSEIGIIGISPMQQTILDKLLEQKRLEYTSLIKTEVCLIVSEKSVLSTKSKVSIEELSELTYIGYLDENASPIKYSVEFSEVWADSPVGSIHVNDLESLRELLSSIDAYSFDLMVHESYLKSKGLKCIPLKEHIEVSIGLIRKKYEPLSLEIQYLIDEITKLYGYQSEL